MGARNKPIQSKTSVTSHDVKLIAVFGILAIHVVSLLCGSVGYFVPNWLGHIPFNYTCNGLGILTDGECNLVVSGKESTIRYVLQMTFIMMTSSMTTIYVISCMIACAMVFEFYKYATYMSFLSVFIGVLYPGAAILMIVASIYVMASFPAWYDYSAILCLVAGSLMFVAYGGLLLYEYIYLTERDRQKLETSKSS